MRKGQKSDPNAAKPSIVQAMPKGGYVYGTSSSHRKTLTSEEHNKLVLEWDERLMREGLPSSAEC